ncbi:MAG: MucB/RseB C-terminal domain-containing protein [Pseudomonas sp.]|jgi:sigma-E factor negative regulatory protein RseB|nr:MucB/RseB C-terminal domain-containing protein [Pseudomonas sp.]
MRLTARCSVFFLWAALGSSAYAAQSANQWLQRLHVAQDTQGYQGAFVYERKGAFSTHQIWRQINAEKQVVERFLQLNGPAHEVMRIDGHVTCMSGAIANALSLADVWPVQSFDVQQLQKWYEIRELGESRVAGRNTVALLFAPRDQHRYPLELHLDEVTAIPLKTLLLNEHGELLERFQFVQFNADRDNNLRVSTTPSIAPSADCQTVSAISSMSDIELDVDWTVSWVPPGFTLINSHYRPSEDGVNNVLSQVYSDGLAHFSIFFERVDDYDVESGRRQLGPTAVVSRRVVNDTQQVMVTVLGEIPIGTAERVALSMQFGSGDGDD